MPKHNEVVEALAASLNPGGQVVTVVTIRDTDMTDDEDGDQIMTYVFAGPLDKDEAIRRATELYVFAEYPGEDSEEAEAMMDEFHVITVQYTDLL
jgi:hypothetical protein